MKQIYSWPWVQAQVAQTVEVWSGSAAQSNQCARQYTPKEQRKREKAYDQALRDVEREVKRAPRSKTERLETQDRIVASFARFSASALDLDAEGVELLTNDFLPVRDEACSMARQLRPKLEACPILAQACRNALDRLHGLQPPFGFEPVGITPSIPLGIQPPLSL